MKRLHEAAQARLTGPVATVMSRLRLSRGRKRSVVDSSGTSVVCMASHGPRLPYARHAVESIADGSVRPGRFILVVNDEDELGREWQELARRGLEIWRGAKRLGPHNKWYPFAVAEANFSGRFVTADDDILYPRRWLEGLLGESSGELVAAYRAHPIRLDENGLAPYRTWIRATLTETDVPFVTGVSGVSYPAKFLREMAAHGEAFLACCPRADDVWVNRTIVRNDWPVRMVSGRSRHFPIVWGSQTQALWMGNVGSDANDTQLRATFEARDIAALRLRAARLAKESEAG